MVTGKAGTGKSTLVRYIRDSDDFPAAVILAPTGIAAINIAGQTLHSFFRLPPRIITPEALEGQRYNRLWNKVEMIVIDEISMVRADILDGIDYILRKARMIDRAFGGVKMVFVGDFYQLPPVTPPHEAEILYQMGYETPFAYSAKVFDELPLSRFSLQTVHRQSEEDFLRVLSDLRRGWNTEDVVDQLNADCHGPHRAGHTPVLLTGTNATANRYNAQGLAAIEAPERTYQSTTKGQFGLTGARLPSPEKLTLKTGARVMALKNDPTRKWVNGSLGTVTALGEKSVQVRFDHSGRVAEVGVASWENVKYQWDERAGEAKAEPAGSYNQIPLGLAWAVTIHKAQGLTLDDVRIDLERGAFAPGQAYVALSRVRTLAGLSLTRALRVGDIIVEAAHGGSL